ncbi:hypothetical protein [Romboutsia sp. MSSM.1001216sp_RTP31141st1_G3_RTP31141_220114]|uniref:hypothetical protein n=1 Tax=unclassified Romboutsia TaxID=2626894 RepID=UPI0031B61188
MAILDINASLEVALTEIENKTAQVEIDRETLENILIGKGVEVIPGSILSVLIEKVRGEVNTRKKVATGSISRKAVSLVSGIHNGVEKNSYCHRIPVKNLGFVPSKIFVYRKEENREYKIKNALSAYYDKDMDSDNCYAFPIYTYSPFGFPSIIPIKANKVITSTGFDMIAGVHDSDYGLSTREYFWLAIGE